MMCVERLFLVCLCFLFISCSEEVECQTSVKKVIQGKVMAEICQMSVDSLGATVGQVSTVIVRGVDEEFSKGWIVFKGEVDDLSVAWVNDHRLMVSYSGGRMHSAIGYWASSNAKSSTDFVRVLLSDATPP